MEGRGVDESGEESPSRVSTEAMLFIRSPVITYFRLLPMQRTLGEQRKGNSVFSPSENQLALNL